MDPKLENKKTWDLFGAISGRIAPTGSPRTGATTSIITKKEGQNNNKTTQYKDGLGTTERCMELRKRGLLAKISSTTWTRWLRNKIRQNKPGQNSKQTTENRKTRKLNKQEEWRYNRNKPKQNEQNRGRNETHKQKKK